jgi:hypothetical protein
VAPREKIAVAVSLGLPDHVGRSAPNGIELRRNTCKPNRRRAQRAEVKAAGVVACSELLDAPRRYAGFSERGELAST